MRLLILLSLIAITSCGPSAEEKKQQAERDSITQIEVRRIMDSVQNSVKSGAKDFSFLGTVRQNNAFLSADIDDKSLLVIRMKPGYEDRVPMPIVYCRMAKSMNYPIREVKIESAEGCYINSYVCE